MLREPGGVELSERIRALVKDPALRGRPARRGAALRGGARAARRRAARAAARRRALGAARPLRRLLARLPGRRARARRRGGARGSTRSPPAGCARPHAAAADRPGGRARARRPAAARRPTGSSARTSPSSTRSRAAYDELAADEPERFAVLDADAAAALAVARGASPRSCRCFSRVAVGVGLVPRPGVGDHLVEPAARRPAQLRARLRGRRDELRRVARTARLLDGRDLAAGDAARRLDHLAHGVAVAGAEVEDLVRRRARARSSASRCASPRSSMWM